MKLFTAIYNTKKYKNMKYCFYAENMNQAKKFRKIKFSAKRVKIVVTEEKAETPFNSSLEIVTKYTFKKNDKQTN